MASKDLLLSLVVPTYNRERFLYEQLCWLLKESLPFMDRTEIIVLDNASSDGTASILQKFSRDDARRLNVHVNEVNVGLVRNCINGIYSAKGKFVWLIGDDDPLDSGLLFKIMSILDINQDNLKLLHLNHRCTNGYKGEVLINSFYPLSKDVFQEDKGYQLVNLLLTDSHTGGFMFITANVVNRVAAIDILKKTSNKLQSQLAFPMYLNAKLACEGGFYYFADNYVSCVYNQSSWINDLNIVYRVQLPHFWFKLRKNGLGRKQIASMIQSVGYSSERRNLFFLFRTLKYKVVFGYWRIRGWI